MIKRFTLFALLSGAVSCTEIVYQDRDVPPCFEHDTAPDDREVTDAPETHCEGDCGAPLSRDAGAEASVAVPDAGSSRVEDAYFEDAAVEDAAEDRPSLDAAFADRPDVPDVLRDGGRDGGSVDGTAAPADSGVIVTTQATCSREGELGCNTNGEVLRCANVRGVLQWWASGVNCRALPGFQRCEPLPTATARTETRQACMNECGGRGCVLTGHVGDRAPTLVCGHLACGSDRCSLVPDRCMCGGVGAMCARHCECASGVCASDGRCG